MTCFDIILENFFTERTLVARPLQAPCQMKQKKSYV